MRNRAAALAAALCLSLAPPALAQPRAPGHAFAPGLAGPGIEDIQTQLEARGYRAGPPTREMIPQLQAAIRRYQRDAGLPVDGIASPALQNHLRYVRAAPPARSTPARDPQVAAAQEELARLGFYRGPIDGLAGPQTRDAVAAFTGGRQTQVDGALMAELRAR